MPSAKDFRNKPLSEMSYEELTSFIKKAESAGFTRSKNKEVGKAEDLRKVMKPQGYDQNTVDAAKAKLQSNTELGTQEKLGIAPPPAAEAGIPGVDSGGLSGATGVPASVDFNKMYDNEMKSPEILKLEKELADKDAAYATATTNINDNPYYSEATRSGHIGKLTQTYQIDKQNLVDQINQKKADVQVKMNIAKMQYDVQQQEYQNNLQRLNLLISSGALLNASGSDIASIALATGMSTGMVRGIMDRMKQDQVKPQVITATDDNGNVTVAVIDGNTGSVISKNSLGAIGNRQNQSTIAKKEDIIKELTGDLWTQASKAQDKKLSPAAYLAARSEAAVYGITNSEFDQMFAEKYAYGSWTDQQGNIDEYKLTTEK